MGTTIYGTRVSGAYCISKKPYNNDWSAYHSCSIKVGLKADFHWEEVRDLHKIIRGADFWDDFPANGLTILNMETPPGDEDQRVDVLYLREDGAVLPCEIKIGGENKDFHGQLIRYLADLSFQSPNIQWVKAKNEAFLSSFPDGPVKDFQKQKFDDFLSRNRLEDKFIRVLPKSGVMMDEEFKPQLLKAVRYLNNYCGFSLRLIKINAFVQALADISNPDFIFRLDFIDIQ